MSELVSRPRAATRPNWIVFLGAATVILAVAVWAIALPDSASGVIAAVVTWVSVNLGWYYILTATVVLAFVLVLALSRVGLVRLGPDHSRPQFRMFTWTSMLFAAGIGIDLMFFAVAEPVTMYFGPPDSPGENVEAARQAVVWAMFHYGLTGWAMYALMGMAFGYFAYRYNLPLSIRSALYPILGKRINGPLGDGVDIAAVVGTIFGIATSLGIGVVQLNYGLTLLFGLPEGLAVQGALIVASVVLATASATSGVEKGIRRLSELNVICAILLMVYVLVTGKTAFLLDGLIGNVGDYASRFLGMTLNTFAFARPDDWLSSWTLFFWAWWIAWSPFVGLFLARISRGRTIRQFVAGTLVVPFGFIVLWLSIFGNSALRRVLDGDVAFGEAAVNTPERGFYQLLEQYPGAPVLIGLATVTGFLFYVTSADSGALVTANFTSHRADASSDGPGWMRIFWAVTTGLLTFAMLLVGGVTTLQNATIIMGLPFSVVLYLIMVGLWRALRVEASNTRSYRASLPGLLSARGRSGGGHWRQRLHRALNYPDRQAAQQFVDTVAAPAITEVAEELRHQGVDADVRRGGVATLAVDHVELNVDIPGERSFRYQVYPVTAPTPNYAIRAQRADDVHFRMEVFSLLGSHGYDLMGYTADQVITDVLDLYERHLQFLQLHHETGGSTAMADGAQMPEDWGADYPTEVAISPSNHDHPTDDHPTDDHPTDDHPTDQGTNSR